MKPNVPERKDDKNVVTVLLGSEDKGIRKNAHCFGCGRIVFNYYSDARIIIVGEMREVARPVDILCSRCKMITRVA